MTNTSSGRASVVVVGGGYGGIRTEILERAAAADHDLIVLGSRGRGGVRSVCSARFHTSCSTTARFRC